MAHTLRTIEFKTVSGTNMAMPLHLKAIFDSIPHQGQRQDSTNAQLHDLLVYGLRLGLTKGIANITRDVPDTKQDRVLTRDLLERIDVQPTCKSSGRDQLMWLLDFANRLGFYDAADILRIRLERYVESESVAA